MSRLKYSTGDFTQSFAAALVRSELVALNAPALEGPFCVGAALAAVAFFSTLVHIWKRQVRGSTHTHTHGQLKLPHWRFKLHSDIENVPKIQTDRSCR